MSKIVLLVIILFMAISVLSCDDNPVSAGFKDRDITWEKIYLDLEEDEYIELFYRSWGNSPESMWLIADCSDYKKNLWRKRKIWWYSVFDRENRMTPDAIWGSAENDVWIYSSDESLHHFDGEVWSKFCDISYKNYDAIGIQNLWGTSSSNIFAVGFAEGNQGNKREAVIIHFNGVSWNFLDIPEFPYSFISIFYDTSESIYIINANDFINSPLSHVYTLSMEDTTLTEIHTSKRWADLHYVNKEVYIGDDQDSKRVIYEYVDNQMKLKYDFTGTLYEGAMLGHSDQDFFCYNDRGITHYNGENFEIVYPLEYGMMPFSAPLLFENEVYFFCANRTSRESFILKGTRN